MKFALATANKGKIKEIKDIVDKLGFDIITRDELGICVDIEETGDTFYKNAYLKAKAICELSGLPAIADDSGICVDALDGAPGVYSSSFGGPDLTDTGRADYLLKTMKNMEQRSANFVCNIVCVFPNGDILSAVGECSGEILTSKRGTNGFGYDPVFRADGYDKSMAELPECKKNMISHRGKAIKIFSEMLDNYINKTG
jgi:XTP/dITP diphosphohydrolase